MKKAVGKKHRVKEIDFTTPDVVVGKYAQRDPNIPKTMITIWLDNDVLEHFKRRAEAPDAPPYQTLINNELRTVIERERKAEGLSVPIDALINNEQFIAAVAAKVTQRIA
jgi:uncharacterized protein (DUF4415 family)